MRLSFPTITVSIVAVLGVATEHAVAQNITVQQPVFRNFSVATTVSVPDRGGAFIGGVKRAGESRSTFGPFPSGTSTGTFREHSGMSAHVFIHDLEEMDRLLLESVSSAAPHQGGPRLGRYAEHAYSSLIGEARGTQRIQTQSRQLVSTVSTHPLSKVKSTRSSSASRSDGNSNGSAGVVPDRAARYFELGRRARQRGSINVARLHFRMAAKYGSRKAQIMLAELDRAQTVAGRTARP